MHNLNKKDIVYHRAWHNKEKNLLTTCMASQAYQFTVYIYNRAFCIKKR